MDEFEDFYADRVIHFERERRVFREYVALITPDQHESHNLEWENKKLENSASDTKSEVNKYNKEARNLETQIKSTIEEINGLKSAKEARIQQIMRLSKLSTPVQRDVTYLVTERFAPRSDSKGAEGLGTIASGYKPMKTGEVLKMEKRLAEETSKTTSYLQDVLLSIREAEEERHRYRKMKVTSNDVAIQKAKELYLAVDETEAQSFLAVSELLRLRVNIMIAQREEVEQLELLNNDKAFFIEKEEKTRQQVRLYILILPIQRNFFCPYLFSHIPFFGPVDFRYDIDATSCKE
jgi:hypothetical protein